jgi:adenylate cyclase
MARRLAAIMFTDVAGSTSLAQADEQGALRLLREQERLVRPLLEIHRGRLVKSMGDGLLIEFSNALDAVECAVDLQRHFQERNARESGPALRVRIGIHLGDVEEAGSDILGDAVNVAARIYPLAEPGGICVSESVYAQVRNKVPHTLEKLGSKSLKGVSEPMEVYRVTYLGVDGVKQAPAPGPPRLAVLPFANFSPDPHDEYFADGLTEELISVISQIRDLRVTSRTSVSQFKAVSKSVAQIGRELGVGSVLEGSVRKSGEHLRITAQLIDVATDDHRWAQTFDRQLDDVFAIQAEVAESVARALKIELLGPERHAIQHRPTSSLSAYEAYLRGLNASRVFDYRIETDRAAADHFEVAIREDPRFAAAYAALANHLIKVEGLTRTGREVFPRARVLAAKALQLDPDSADGHTALGNSAMQADQDWSRAEAEFLQALALNPSDSETHVWYAMLLMLLQRYDEAERELLAAIELDPLWLNPREALVGLAEARGDWEASVRLAEQLVETFRTTPSEALRAELNLAWAYAYAGRSDSARKIVDSWTDSTHPLARMTRAALHAFLGDSEELRSSLEQFVVRMRTEFHWTDYEPTAYVLLGENAKALTLLEESFRNGERTLWNSYQSPFWDPVRDDPRFIALLRELNLPTTSPRRIGAPRSPTLPRNPEKPL